MQQNKALIFAGLITVFGGLMHLAAIVGGPSWYAFIGAPDEIIAMVKLGRQYPAKVCWLIATFLFICASYAFSGAKILPRLPFLHFALSCMAAGFLLRGLSFIPIVILFPDAFIHITNSRGVDALMLLTSLICVTAGLCYAIGLRQLRQTTN
ncbi:MAG: hypothetical protein V4447_05345 [Pseudomonadota bacterium]